MEDNLDTLRGTYEITAKWRKIREADLALIDPTQEPKKHAYLAGCLVEAYRREKEALAEYARVKSYVDEANKPWKEVR